MVLSAAELEHLAECDEMPAKPLELHPLIDKHEGADGYDRQRVEDAGPVQEAVPTNHLGDAELVAIEWPEPRLSPGHQSVRFELEPACFMYFEFREGGTGLPTGPEGLDATQHIRAVGHDGRVTGDGLQRSLRVQVSAPGLYEINFEGLTGDLYHPIMPRRVSVRAGEPTEVIVELHPPSSSRAPPGGR